MWRASKSDDDGAIERMCLALYAEDPSPEHPSADQIRRTLAALRDAPTRGRAVVLEVDGQLGGYALLISFWSNELGGEVCVIDELYVVSPLRSRGYASRLIDDLARGAKLCPPGAVALALETTPDNARARALYQRLGFNGKNVSMRRRIAARPAA